MGLLALPVALTTRLVRGLVDASRTPMALARLADAAGRLAMLADALEDLPTDDVLSRLDVLNGNLERLASADEALAELAGTAAVLSELAAVRPVLETLAKASESLPALAEVGPSLHRLADASEALERLSHQSTVLPAIAANSRTLPKLPDRMVGLEDTMDRLEASVRVLAEATAPLQGTTQRLGRLVDRLPERRRRDEDD